MIGWGIRGFVVCGFREGVAERIRILMPGGASLGLDFGSQSPGRTVGRFSQIWGLRSSPGLMGGADGSDLDRHRLFSELQRTSQQSWPVAVSSLNRHPDAFFSGVAVIIDCLCR